MTKTQTLTLRLIEDGDGYRVTEPTADPVGEGETAHDAVIDYVERAREVSQQKAMADGGKDQ